MENKRAKSQSSGTNSFCRKSRTINLHDLKKLAKITGSAKLETVITQKVFELQPRGLTSLVILACGLIINLKKKFNMSATKCSYFG